MPRTLQNRKSPFDILRNLGLVAYGCVNLSGGILPYVGQSMIRAVDYQDWGRCFSANVPETSSVPASSDMSPPNKLSTLKKNWIQAYQTISKVDPDNVMRESLKARNVQICLPRSNGNLGQYTPFVDYIYFDPKTPQPIMLATALHEIRHLEQDIATPEWGNILQSPKQKLARIFIAEADAEAHAVRKSWVLRARFGDARAWDAIQQDGLYYSEIGAFLCVMEADKPLALRDTLRLCQTGQNGQQKADFVYLTKTYSDRIDIATRAVALDWLNNKRLVDGYADTFRQHHGAVPDLWKGWVDTGFIDQWRKRNNNTNYLDDLVIGTAERAVFYQDPRAAIRR